jgi:hypothetical protein
MELYHAHHQWATRPADQRFNSLEELYQVTRDHAEVARTKDVSWKDLRVEARNDNLALVGRAGVPAKLTHYSFGQLASRIGAPASYLRDLPPTLAAQNLNHGLARRGDDGTAQLLFHTGDDLVLRAATSQKYSRIWNYEVVSRLIDLSHRHGLVPAQETFKWDGTGINPNAEKALYASDHDLFAFVMSPDRVVEDPTGSALRRGVIVINSEVGDKALKFMGFLFRDVCSNHIIWGAEQLAEISLRHVGDIKNRMLDAQLRIRRYLDGAASLDEAKFEELTVRIADDKDAVLDRIFGIRSIGLSRKALAASYDAVIPEQDGDPRTVWGLAQGVTRHSQSLPYADERTELDRAAGRLLEVAF